jgi:hypothetical protein
MTKHMVDKFEENLKQLSKLTNLKSELEKKLETQVKFLTSIEKIILIKSKEKSQPEQFKSLFMLNNETSE